MSGSFHVKRIFRKSLQFTSSFRYNSKKALGVKEMQRYYSYTEFMKAVGKNSSSIQSEKLLSEIYMDLFLKRIHREQVKERILSLIDGALDRRDESKFKEYVAQLKKIEDNH